jgi:MFS family permease
VRVSPLHRGVTIGSFYFGRRHLWYSIGVLLTSIGYFCLFGRCVVCDVLGTDVETTNEIGILVYYVLSAMLLNVGWAAVQVSHMALVPELTPDTDTRVVLNSVRYIGTVSSSLFIFALLAMLIYIFDLSDKDQFQYLTLVALGVGLVTTPIFLFGTEEQRPRNEQIEYDAQQAAKRDQLQVGRDGGVRAPRSDKYQSLSGDLLSPDAIEAPIRRASISSSNSASTIGVQLSPSLNPTLGPYVPMLASSSDDEYDAAE